MEWVSRFKKRLSRTTTHSNDCALDTQGQAQETVRQGLEVEAPFLKSQVRYFDAGSRWSYLCQWIHCWEDTVTDGEAARKFGRIDGKREFRQLQCKGWSDRIRCEFRRPECEFRQSQCNRVGQHKVWCLPLSKYSMVRKHKRGQVHDAEGSPVQRIPACIWDFVRLISS